MSPSPRAAVFDCSVRALWNVSSGSVPKASYRIVILASSAAAPLRRAGQADPDGERTGEKQGDAPFHAMTSLDADAIWT